MSHLKEITIRGTLVCRIYRGEEADTYRVTVENTASPEKPAVKTWTIATPPGDREASIARVRGVVDAVRRIKEKLAAGAATAAATVPAPVPPAPEAPPSVPIPVEVVRPVDVRSVADDEDCAATLRNIAALSEVDRRRGFLTGGKRRMTANLCAARVLTAKVPGEELSPQERELLRFYSGSGGFSDREFMDLQERWPEGVLDRPEARGLIHEFYTPPNVCDAVARVFESLLPELPKDARGKVLTLEPSAGIGRFVNAFMDRPALRTACSWRVVEYSAVSARLIAALHGGVTVYHGPFESWAEANDDVYGGEVGAVISNPPYGARGAAWALDKSPLSRFQGGKAPHKELSNAWAYFLRRSSDMLARGGLGVYLIPSGFMNAQRGDAQKIMVDVLRRHHIAAAFRLPSNLFPGGGLEGGSGHITDLVFLRSRGGVLPAIPKGDQYIMDGRYFEEHPTHVLGVVSKGTGRYGGDEVKGEFNDLPPFEMRPLAPDAMAPDVPRRKLTPEELAKRAAARRRDITFRLQASFGALSPVADLAVRLGTEVDTYLRLSAHGETAEHVRMRPELVERLRDFAASFGNPHGAADVKALVANGNAPAARLLQAFDESGHLMPWIVATPVWEPKIDTRVETVREMLDVLRRTLVGRKLSIRAMPTAAASMLGVDPSAVADRIIAELPDVYAAGWRLTGDAFDELVPKRDLLRGWLWPRYDLAKGIASGRVSTAVIGGKVHGTLPLSVVEAQAREIMEAIGPVTLDSFTFRPTERWLPPHVLSSWLYDQFGKRDGRPRVKFEWVAGFLVPEMVKRWEDFRPSMLSPAVNKVLGWINADNGLLGEEDATVEDTVQTPEGSKKVKRVVETAASKRSKLAAQWAEEFRGWLADAPKLVRGDGDGAGTFGRVIDDVEEAYNRQFRGVVLVDHDPEPLHIRRWRGPQARQLRAHQVSAVWRLRENNYSGVAAFDVGVGKTYMLLALLALARQEGRVRRPVVVVPNGIAWKWFKDFAEQLPDYRVAVIGSKKVIVDGVERSKTDSPEERAAKWTQFQAGAYEAVILTYSSLGRTRMSVEGLEAYFTQHEDIAREETRKKRNEDERLDAFRARLEKIKAKQRLITEMTARGETKKLPKLNKRELEDLAREERGGASIRDDAMKGERVRAKITELLQIPDSWEYDPGVEWDALGVDFLAVDEAQNFSNGFDPSGVTGDGVVDDTPVKYLNGGANDVRRFWWLDFRCKSVRERQNGGGIVFLSATPARNSPRELYNLWQMVDHDYFRRMGIRCIDDFVARYCVISIRSVADPDGSVRQGKVLSGFKNVPELVEILTRMGIFKTAEQVGIKLPEPFVEYADADGGSYVQENGTFRDSKGEVVDITSVGIAMDEKQTERTEFYRDEVRDVRRRMKLGKSNPEYLSRVMGMAAIGEAMSRMAMVAVHGDLADYTSTVEPVVDHEADQPEDGPPVYKKSADGSTLYRTKNKAVWNWDNAHENPNYASPKFTVLAKRITRQLSCGQVVIAPPGREQAMAEALAEKGTPLEVILVFDNLAKLPELARFASGRIRKPGDYHVVVTSRAFFDAGHVEGKSCAVFAEDSYGDDDNDKLAAMAEAVFLARTCGHIVFVDYNAAHVWVKKTLVDAGVPAERIAVLNRSVSTLDRQRIAEAFNGDASTMSEPEYDVVIANAVAYEGVDLNKRTCAIHHLDYPWNPSVLQQRNGRGVRQGNVLSSITIVYYFSSRSFDGKRFLTIVGKGNWMSALFEGHQRATNNPGAGFDLTDDDIDLFISGNPDETRKLQRRSRLAATWTERKTKRLAAAASAREANAAFRRAEKAADGGARAGLRATAERNMLFALAAPADAWPFADFAARARDSTVAFTEAGAPVYEGARIAVPADEKGTMVTYYEVGAVRVRGPEFSAAVRRVGVRQGTEEAVAVTALWEEMSSRAVSTLLDVSRPIVFEEMVDPLTKKPEEVATFPLLSREHYDPDGWPKERDERALGEWIDKAIGGDAPTWGALSLWLAPQAWLSDFWQRRGADVLAAVARTAGAAQGRPIPAMYTLPGATEPELRLLTRQEAASERAKVFPPTRAGLRAYLDAAAVAREVDKASEHSAAVAWWWGPDAEDSLPAFFYAVGDRAARLAAERAKVAPTPAP